MLTANQFDAVWASMDDLYEEYTQSVLNDIARRLAGLPHPTATAAWQVQRLQESGLLYEDILTRLAALVPATDAQLRVAFKAAGIQAIKFDDAIYKAAGLAPLPLNLSPAMAQLLNVAAIRTNGVMNNLTLTTALSGQQSFIRAADVAFLQVTTGTMSYDQAIRAAVINSADAGLLVHYPSGHTDQLGVAMRRSVLTGVGQATGELQVARAAEVGSDLVQTSAHSGARPSHAEWQGKIFSLSGTSEKYPDFRESTQYGTGGGLGGWNCRHSFFPFFEGLSENAYSKATLNEYAGKQVTYAGKKVDIYEATQIQRGLERNVRKYKRQASALSAANLDNTAEIGKVQGYQAKLRSFTSQTGLQRQGVREGSRVLIHRP